ncbi:MAG: class I SAM-dependent methyltransferase, partial [Flavobacteriales bacterium]
HAERKAHWENIYQTKRLEDVSWYQKKPETSLAYFEDVDLEANIIDIGGGDSFLVDFLLDLGFKNISVLDISEKAIERAKVRLGEKAKKIHWIISDSADFQTDETFDVWHDRAAFHFLNTEEDIKKYKQNLYRATTAESKIILASFSDKGPKKCSGIEITQYNETDFRLRFEPEFQLVDSQIVSHQTPFDSSQEFIYAQFQKKKNDALTQD